METRHASGSSSRGKQIDIVEGIDYYVESGGRLVFTEVYHLRRGYCCGGRCRHCPWKTARPAEPLPVSDDT